MPLPDPLTRLWRWWRSTHTPVRVAFRRPWPTTRRGLALWILSLITAWLGFINYVATDLPPTSQASLAFALAIRPAPFWGTIMVVLGLLSAWTSYCHLGRDRAGFVFLGTFCAWWSAVYVCGFLAYDAGLRALGGAVIWLAFALLLGVVAGFPSTPLDRSDIASPACRPDDA